MIGVIVPKVASTSIGKIVEGILSVLNESGYQMLLAVTQNNPKKELEYLAAFNDKQVDGVIFAATILTAEHKRALKKLSVPVILVGQQYPGHCCIYHDDYHATRDLTGAVVAMGRRNPGYIGAIIQDKAVGTERFRGYEDAVSEAGIPDCAQRWLLLPLFLIPDTRRWENCWRNIRIWMLLSVRRILWQQERYDI